MIHAVLIALLIFLILCSGVLSASETAMFSLSSMKVRGYRFDKSYNRKLIARLLSKPRELLVTILIVNVAMNILIQNTVSALFGTLSGWLLSVGVPLALTLVFGEVLPKTIAIANNTKISYVMAPVIYGIQKILGPIRIFMTFITGWVSRILFFFLQKGKNISIEELKHALKASKEYGMLSNEEAKLIRGYLSLEELIAKELMRPRVDILQYDINDPIDQLVYIFVDQERTRVPVCDGDLENVLGIISSDLFFLIKNKLKKSKDLLAYLDKPFYVPETICAKHLLSQFNEKHETFAIVVDEYGSICGIITKEDLVEVVVGQIEDKIDEKMSYTKQSEDVIIASGKLELAELEEIFDVLLISEGNMVTIGGWLTEQMGDIPKTGNKFVTDQFLFYVLSATPTKVHRIYIRRLRPQKKQKRMYGQ